MKKRLQKQRRMMGGGGRSVKERTEELERVSVMRGYKRGRNSGSKATAIR